MEQEYFDAEKDGFYGVYYENAKPAADCIIAMLGDSSDDYMARSCVKWLHKQGVSVMAMSPDKKDYGLLVRFAFRAGKQFPKECRQARIDVDRKLSAVLQEWKTRNKETGR
ncbi:MAG: hypothetical protein Q4B22_07020 [Eubacteriales bacterium]|nr:hypothetical protein [Eubacteriales bacterium]